MIRALRKRHRRTVVALGVSLPLAFAVGIVARRPVPVMTVLPKELAISQKESADVAWERHDLFTKTPLEARLLSGRADAGRRWIEFSTTKDVVKPDMLVYWVIGQQQNARPHPDPLPQERENHLAAPGATGARRLDQASASLGVQKLPDDAVLLGAFKPSEPLALPANVGEHTGMMVLYSLADQEVVEVSKPFKFQKP